ncbi:MAG TPA: hypothetical protein VKX46_19010, partial [Ktedonobacteraceae bacterium]|nr:hypothetical protein [Ktedonobacteraceae bacterium]
MTRDEHIPDGAPEKRYQALLMTNAGIINEYIRQLPKTSRILGRMLPCSNARDDIAWEEITQVRRFPEGRFEAQT